MAAGVAVTVTASTDQPPGLAPLPVDEREYHRFLESVEGPKLVVVRDLDDPPGGAMWGEWNANVHRALGCVGTVTQGAVRDLDALERLGFHAFSTSVSVAHGYGVFVGYGDQVTVAGLTVATGDLLVGDRHGVLSIPASIDLDELLAVAQQIDDLEAEIFRYCQSAGFTVDGLAALEQSVLSR